MITKKGNEPTIPPARPTGVNVRRKSMCVHLHEFIETSPRPHERDNNFAHMCGARGRKKQSNYESGVANENHQVAEVGGSPPCRGDHETLMGTARPGSDQPTARQPRERAPWVRGPRASIWSPDFSHPQEIAWLALGADFGT